MSHSDTPIRLGFTDEEVPPGAHICYIYPDDNQRFELLAQYLKAGRETNEKNDFITETFSPSEARERFRQAGFDPDAHPECVIETAADAYYPGGVFETDRMLDSLVDSGYTAVDEGFNRLRITGELSWLERDIPGADDILEYEAKLTQTLAKHPVTCICQYDARRFTGEFLAEVLHLHPYVIVSGQLVRNPYFVEPDEFLATATHPMTCHERRL